MGLDAGWGRWAGCWGVCGLERPMRNMLPGCRLMAGVGGMSRTGRGRERPRAEIAVVRVLEKRLGALPVVAQFGRRLRIAEIVDELCPVRPVAWDTHRAGIQALIAQ